MFLYTLKVKYIIEYFTRNSLSLKTVRVEYIRIWILRRENHVIFKNNRYDCCRHITRGLCKFGRRKRS